MERTEQYTREKLESKTTSELQWYYMEAFKDARNLQKLGSSFRLEIITRVLFDRNEIREKIIIRCQIKKELAEAVQSERYEEASLFRDMLNYYDKHIMG